MNCSQSFRYLNSFLDLEKLSQFPKNSFFNLKRMEHLLEAGRHPAQRRDSPNFQNTIEGRPEKKFFPILIAGTTGKGSTGFFLESILKANGIRVGYYHSPHVERPSERIRVQGAAVSSKLWVEGLSLLQKLLLKNPLPKKLGVLTYFEVLTFLAIWIFARTGIQIGIFEIGLGGRLDATNVLKAPLVILTPIHLDHEAFLGSTIAKIAREKAAIIKPRGHIVIGKQFPEALRVIRRAVKRNRGHLWKAKPVAGIPLGLSGDFQKMNAGVAWKAAEILKTHFNYPVSSERAKKGLQARNWKGRMENFQWKGRRVILDGAHNPISIRELVRSLKIQGIQNAWLVFGAMNDKNSREMLKILSGSFSKVILTGIKGNRAKTIGMLAGESKGLFKCVLTAQNIKEAMDLLKRISRTGEDIVVTGSFYLVGEARKILKAG